MNFSFGHKLTHCILYLEGFQLCAINFLAALAGFFSAKRFDLLYVVTHMKMLIRIGLHDY